MTTIQVRVPDTLLVQSGQGRQALEQRSQFLLALKYFELGELSSGQAAGMCGMARIGFLIEAARFRVPATELSDEELALEFRNG